MSNELKPIAVFGKNRSKIVCAIDEKFDGIELIVPMKFVQEPMHRLFIWLCSFDTRRRISRVSDAPAKIVDGGFQKHFAEL